MKNILFGVISILIANQSMSQVATKPCYRITKIKKQEKELIREICIPKGYIINHIYTRLVDLDANGDGLSDVIFDWHKQNLRDADTIYLTVYKMNKDSSYSLLKTFRNLLPVYISDYNNRPQKKTINRIYECYNESPPLISIGFDNGTITLTIRIDPASGYLFKYVYKPERENWYLATFQEWIDMPDGIRKSENREILKEDESIDDFSYQKYLCPEESFKK